MKLSLHSKARLVTPLLAALVAFGCTPPPEAGSSTSTIAVTGVVLDLGSAAIKVGGTQQLTATVAPADATDKSFSWSTSAKEVATVSASGLVTGVAAGSATVTATTTDGGKTASCTVTVTAAITTTTTTTPVAVTGVSLDKTTLSLAKDATSQLAATVAPADATNKSVSWSSDAESVATVSSSGLVTAKSVGTATITVKTGDGSKTATCTVTVNDGSTGGIGVTIQ
jgi:trimeric autotransporter adhesin